ncbi:MAG: hypothetical protein HXX10_01245 [Rhodoplanes sp.]|uniref:hypothetical protein n=1 Tax=Rhodoplanes sp. TaxID=1968906 RepID=UPI0018243B42|nr:hypothetical protein [Rhodoplanes sp.]NVO12639.1 hypothetical protein [Rhodoplanes sp.]
MPVTTEVDGPLGFVAIKGPGVDALHRRKETTTNPKIAATDLRHNFNHVREALFAEIAALVRVAPGGVGRERSGRG